MYYLHGNGFASSLHSWIEYHCCGLNIWQHLGVSRFYIKMRWDMLCGWRKSYTGQNEKKSDIGQGLLIRNQNVFSDRMHEQAVLKVELLNFAYPFFLFNTFPIKFFYPWWNLIRQGGGGRNLKRAFIHKEWKLAKMASEKQKWER